MRYGEVPITRKKTKIIPPSAQQLEESAIIGSQIAGWALSVTVPCPETVDSSSFVDELYRYFEDVNCNRNRYAMVSVYRFEIRKFRIDRHFRGVTIYFEDFTDAVALRLAIADRYFGELI